MRKYERNQEKKRNYQEIEISFKYLKDLEYEWEELYEKLSEYELKQLINTVDHYDYTRYIKYYLKEKEKTIEEMNGDVIRWAFQGMAFISQFSILISNPLLFFRDKTRLDVLRYNSFIRDDIWNN